jgi:hypothetical protein
MRKPSIQKASDSSPRWGLILPTALAASLSTACLYLSPAFEFNSQQTILSTVSWTALWPGLIGFIVIAASSRLRAGIAPPAAGDILVVYQQVPRLLQKIVSKLGLFNTKIFENMSLLFYPIFTRSQFLLRDSNRYFVIATPGTVMVIILVLLFYTFVS